MTRPRSFWEPSFWTPAFGFPAKGSETTEARIRRETGVILSVLLLPLLVLILSACAPEAPASGAPPADSGDAFRRRDDAGWSPCVGARPAGCGRCPEGQNALWRRKADGSIEAACFDERTGEKVGTPRLRRVGGNGDPVDDNGREVGE